jgi:hypothetical protein
VDVGVQRNDRAPERTVVVLMVGAVPVVELQCRPVPVRPPHSKPQQKMGVIAALPSQ